MILLTRTILQGLPDAESAMKLLKYRYKLSDIPGRDDWVMDTIDLQELNLIVGKNASGKSRVLILPTAFSEMIMQSKQVLFGDWEFTFITDDNRKIFYKVVNNKNTEIEEKLVVQGKAVLKRKDGITNLYSKTKKKFEKITPPDDKLVLHVRRDKEEYPFLEDIVKWADQTHAFNFGQIHPNFISGIGRSEGNITTAKDIPALIEKSDDSLKEKIIYKFNKLGYNIDKIYSQPEGEIDFLYIKEQGLKNDLVQSQLSQGMFRALSLIVFIYYIIDKNMVRTIIVDDLCEGLDYDRATKLGKLLFEELQNKKIQFIVSSNDSFLMDVVNIKYWNILARENNTIKVYNYKNSKEKFDQFKYSGLNNFDLFSSDYLEE